MIVTYETLIEDVCDRFLEVNAERVAQEKRGDGAADIGVHIFFSWVFNKVLFRAISTGRKSLETGSLPETKMKKIAACGKNLRHPAAAMKLHTQQSMDCRTCKTLHLKVATHTSQLSGVFSAALLINRGACEIMYLKVATQTS
jgi:hypothetical protein